MTSARDNERLVRVGPGTPGGEMLRRYWHPALLSIELADNDCPPVRLRILGEDLIAFRDTSGRIGIVEAFCSHRRAPLFLGRNEKDGIRCVYHGWKFDTQGRCVDLPNQEGSSEAFMQKAAIKAYPTFEHGGLVWIYMGPPEEQPAEPDFEWARAPATHRAVSKTIEACNYLQALEGGLDTAHVSFLHNESVNGATNLFTGDAAPRLAVYETDYGFAYTSTRKTAGQKNWVRQYQYVLPAQAMRPSVVPTGLGEIAHIPRYAGHIWVPIDDEHCWVYNWMAGYDESTALSHEYVEEVESFFGRGSNDVIPGTFMLKANMSNDYLIDREKQKYSNYSGIRGINTQDFALQELMGPIVDRSRELLCATDRAITAMRRMLLDQIDRVEQGEPPKGREAGDYRSIRPHDAIIEAGEDWDQVCARSPWRW